MGKQGLFKSTVMFFLVALLAGCGVMPSATTLAVAECAVADSTPSLYRIQPEDWLRGIYNRVGMADVASKETRYLEARNAAFEILGHQVQRWSDYVDLGLSDGNNVRITITYLSPQLIETVLLNQMLVNREIGYSEGDFIARILEKLAGTTNRNVALFQITITAIQYGSSPSSPKPIAIDIPLENLKLTNSANLSVQTKYDDHSLDNVISLAHGPFSGQIGYQMTVKSGDACSLLLDPQINNTISIHLDGMKINDVDAEPLTWTIRYESLLGGNGPGMSPNYDTRNLPPDLSGWARPTSVAPTPINLPTTNPDYWDGYWRDMGRYLWEQVTFANSP